MNAFRRSGTFGLVGVFVVAGAAAVIALTLGQGQANPRPALALIFGLIGAFCLALFALQGRDLSAGCRRCRAEGGRRPAARGQAGAAARRGAGAAIGTRLHAL